MGTRAAVVSSRCEERNANAADNDADAADRLSLTLFLSLALFFRSPFFQASTGCKALHVPRGDAVQVGFFPFSKTSTGNDVFRQAAIEKEVVDGQREKTALLLFSSLSCAQPSSLDVPQKRHHIYTTGSARSLGQHCARALSPERSPFRRRAMQRRGRRRRRRLPLRPRRSMCPGLSCFFLSSFS